MYRPLCSSLWRHQSALVWRRFLLLVASVRHMRYVLPVYAPHSLAGVCFCFPARYCTSVFRLQTRLHWLPTVWAPGPHPCARASGDRRPHQKEGWPVARSRRALPAFQKQVYALPRLYMKSGLRIASKVFIVTNTNDTVNNYLFVQNSICFSYNLVCDPIHGFFSLQFYCKRCVSVTEPPQQREASVLTRGSYTAVVPAMSMEKRRDRNRWKRSSRSF